MSASEGERSHTIERSVNAKTGERAENQEFINLDESKKRRKYLLLQSCILHSTSLSLSHTHTPTHTHLTPSPFLSHTHTLLSLCHSLAEGDSFGSEWREKTRSHNRLGLEQSRHNHFSNSRGLPSPSSRPSNPERGGRVKRKNRPASMSAEDLPGVDECGVHQAATSSRYRGRGREGD